MAEPMIRKTSGRLSIKALLVALLFIAAVVSLMIANSPKPFGIDFVHDEIPVAQVVGVQKAAYQETYRMKREFIGQIEARQSSAIGFELSGILKRVAVDEGDVVKAGDILADLDTTRLAARRQEAQAALVRSKAEARLAHLTFKRIAELRKVDVATAQEKDDALAARDMAQAMVDVVAAQLQRILVDIEKSRLIAPFEGTVIRRLIDEGTVVSPGQSVLEVQQNDHLEVRVGVTAIMAEALRIGEQHELLISGQTFRATITSILPLRNRNRTVDIILKLHHSAASTRPGDVVRLLLAYEVTQRGFWAPISSLREGRRGLWSLYVVEASPEEQSGPLGATHVASRRMVEVLDISDDQAFISGSIDDGEHFVTRGAHKLVPDQPVRLNAPSNPKS